MKTRILLTIAVIYSVMLLNTCKKEVKQSEEVKPEIIKEKISGFVQKGPYVNGTSVFMSELNDSLNQTGKIFTTQIIDNKGNFEVSNIQLSSQYVEFKADGFYFDEIKGEKSIAPLTLFALSDITNKTTINVNILTHLEKERVRYLINNGLTFTQAKDSAQKEILSIFGINNNIVNSEDLDISVNNDDNAKLLAISIILQGNRSVGDLSELLANISSDIREDGVLNSPTTRALIFNAVQTFNLDTIRRNIEKRYEEVGVITTIPNFEKYIPEKIIISANITYPNDCNSQKGFIDISIMGGTPPYSILWSNGETTEDINNIDVGKYSITVTDANSTHTSKEFVISGIICDSDGNIYKTIRIGNQIWMAENLKSTKYDDGEAIPYLSDNSINYGAYCWYNNNTANKDQYGALYNWYAINSGKLCPKGWHVPTSNEWVELINYIGGWKVAGGKLKETGTTHWQYSGENEGATNEFGFTALPGGVFWNGFNDLGRTGEWWSSTECDACISFCGTNCVDFYYIFSDDSSVSGGNNYKTVGLSVRCIKD